MTDIEEGNLLIAQFVAKQNNTEAELEHDLKKSGTIESMSYHHDWNSLMEVIEVCNEVAGSGLFFMDDLWQEWDNLTDWQGGFLTNDCKAVRDEIVIPFINKYNELQNK